jgi:hypothetical protein
MNIITRMECAWLTDGVFGLDDRIYWHLIHSPGNYRQCSVIAVLRTFHFTVTHALKFSIIISRILATDLSQSHCHFKAQMKFSFHSLIPFLPLFCNCQFNSSAPKLISWQAGVSKLNSVLFNWILPYNHFAQTTQKMQPLYCWEGVFTAPLHSNENY